MSTPTDTVQVSLDGRATKAEPASWLYRQLWQPSFTVFVFNACIMILELVAGRIIAPYVGGSRCTPGPASLLTDQYAPVDQMLAAVFREEVPR